MIIGDHRGKAIKEHVQRTYGQSQRGYIWGWGGEAWWGDNGDNCTWTTIQKKDNASLPLCRFLLFCLRKCKVCLWQWYLQTIVFDSIVTMWMLKKSEQPFVHLMLLGRYHRLQTGLTECQAYPSSFPSHSPLLYLFCGLIVIWITPALQKDLKQIST